MALTRVKKVSNASLAGSISADKLNIGQIGGRRNIVINGAMQVFQRGTSFTSVSSTAFHADRFELYLQNTASVYTVTQDSDAPNGFANSLKLDVTTADTSTASNEEVKLFHKLEGQDLQQFKKGTSDAEQMTLSFYVKTNKTGVYCVELYDRDNNRDVSASYTVSDTGWNRYVITFPADTTGAFDDDNASSLEITFWLIAGSAVQGGTLNTSWRSVADSSSATGQVNFADSTDNNWAITGVQLEVGDQATPFEHRSYAEELELCKRYFQKFGGGANKTIAHVYAPSTSELALLLRFAPELRTSPSLDWSSDTTDLTYRYSGNNSQNFDRSNLNDDGTVGQVTPQGGSMWMHGWSHGQSSNDGGEIRVLAVSPEEFLFLQFDAEL